jgi:hypothetical protein
LGIGQGVSGSKKSQLVVVDDDDDYDDDGNRSNNKWIGTQGLGRLGIPFFKNQKC